MAYNETIFNANICINKISDVRDFNSDMLIRVPVRTRQEVEILLQEGVSVYEKITETPHGGRHKQYYCEVWLSDLAKVAHK
jgi:hypothetical protein